MFSQKPGAWSAVLEGLGYVSDVHMPPHMVLFIEHSSQRAVQCTNMHGSGFLQAAGCSAVDTG
jgi:hypothetical protein